MAVAEELQRYEVDCFENRWSSAASRLEIKPRGMQYTYSVGNIPSRDSIMWFGTPEKPNINGVEGLLLVITTSEKAPTDLQDDSAEDNSYFLRTVCFLDATDHKREAADLAIDKLDDLLNAEDFQKCNEILRSAVPDSMSDLLIVTFLGITLAAKRKLKSRESFYARALAVVSGRRGQLGAEGLLSKYR